MLVRKGLASVDASPEKYSPAKATRSRGHGTSATFGASRGTREEQRAAELRAELDVLRAAAPIDWPTVTPGTIDAQLIVDARLADDDYARIKRQGEQAWSRVVRRHTRATGGAQ